MIKNFSIFTLRTPTSIVRTMMMVCSLVLVCVAGITSCAGTPAVTEEEPFIRLLPDQFSDMIEGRGKCNAEQLTAFFLAMAPEANATDIADFAALYIEECNAENINSDIAFCQMCHETGYLRFGNLVSAEMNNFCGLGAINKDQRGCVFDTRRNGIRAHIQHLKAYGSTEPLKQECIDPRYRYVVPKGKSPSFYGLAGTWAADKEYGRRLEEKLISLYTISGFITK